MPDRAFGLSHEVNSNQHNIKINQTLIRDLGVLAEHTKGLCIVLKKEIDELRKDTDKNTEKINYIYDYIVKKKEREDAKWF